MTEHADEGGFTPEQALETLTELEGYEEGLTARTEGLTWMIWAAIVAGIFMTYNVAGHWTTDHGAPGWVFAVLWAPWTGLGILGTRALWRSTAITLDRDPDDGPSLLWSLGYTMLFFAIMAAVYGAIVLADLQLDTNTIMLVVTGLFTVAIGFAYRSQGLTGTWSHVLAGVVLVLAGLGLSATAWSSPALGMTAAGLVATVYASVGGALYARG